MLPASSAALPSPVFRRTVFSLFNQNIPVLSRRPRKRASPAFAGRTAVSPGRRTAAAGDRSPTPGGLQPIIEAKEETDAARET